MSGFRRSTVLQDSEVSQAFRLQKYNLIVNRNFLNFIMEDLFRLQKYNFIVNRNFMNFIYARFVCL